ncbi:MAG: hypothetical protein RR689_05530 [Mucinivorans sp.]
MTIIFDKQLKIISVMNPLPHTLFNCPYKKLVGLHIDNLINYAVELYQEEVQMVIDRVREAQKSKEEFFFRIHDQQHRRVELSHAMLRRAKKQ